MGEDQALPGRTVESRGFHPAAAVGSRVPAGPVVRNGKEDVGLFRPSGHTAAKRRAQASDTPQRSNSTCFDESFYSCAGSKCKCERHTPDLHSACVLSV